MSAFGMESMYILTEKYVDSASTCAFHFSPTGHLEIDALIEKVTAASMGKVSRWVIDKKTPFEA